MGYDSLGTKVRELIIADYNSGMTQASICAKYDVEKSKMSRLVAKYRSTGDVTVTHRGGRPRLTTPREDLMIARSTKKDPFKSAEMIRNELNLNVTLPTIRARLRENGLFSRRPAKKSLISEKNRKKRLRFAKRHRNWSVDD